MTPEKLKKLNKIVKQLVQFFDEGTPILIVGVQNDQIGAIGNIVPEERPEFLRNTADALEATPTHGNN